MKGMRWVAFLLMGLAVAGCRTTTPLAALPPAQRDSLAVALMPGTKPDSYFTSAAGRDAQQEGSNMGLIGIITGDSYAAHADSPGHHAIRRIRAADGDFETPLVLEKFKTHLQSANLHADGSQPGRKLLIDICAVGLYETQKGYVSPYLDVSVQLQDKNHTPTWKAHASSIGTQFRTLDTYCATPRLYQTDFEEVADDVARQLIIGPIR